MKDRNENRPGYKKTKMGWIPEEWKCPKIGEACRLSSGGTPDRGILSYWKGQIPWATTKEINYNIIIDTREKISELGLRESSAKVFSKGTLLMAMYGQGATRGRVALLGRNAAINQACLAIIPRDKDVLPLYLYHLLHHEYYRVRSFSQGSNQHNLNSDLIAAIQIILPGYSEQVQIVDILSTWDEAIDQAQQLIRTKKQQKTALMQQLLFGRKRLPPYAKPNGKTTCRFFELPEDWECPRIREIAQECSRRNSARNDLPVLACSKHLGFVESSEYFSKRVFSEDTSNYKIIRQGEFGFPSNHIEEGSIGLLKKQAAGLVSPIYTVFRCNKKVVPEYLYAVFKTNTFRHIFKVSTNASVNRRGSLRWKEFSLIHVPMPSLEEQKAIVKVLKTSEDEIFQLEAKLSALEKQKRGLMQKLLTGEVRVKP